MKTIVNSTETTWTQGLGWETSSEDQQSGSRGRIYLATPLNSLQAPVGASVLDGEEHHEAAEIPDSKLKHKMSYYLVKQATSPFSQSEWVKASNVRAHLVA